MEDSAIFFLYARKSTDEADRQVLSIDAQLFELRELAKREGITIAYEYIESMTAKRPGRPVFNEMLAEIERGKAQGIIAWHPDRLARNSMDGGRIIYLTDIGKILELKFPTFRFEATAHGKFMLSIAFSQSKYYVDNLSENIKRGYRQKLRNGIWPTCAPLGYLNDKVPKCIITDEARAPLIRKAFQLYATGDHSLAEVCRQINALGLTGRNGAPLRLSKYHQIFRNPIYHGLILFNGEIYEGKHEPIITKATFDRVQEALRRKSKPKTPQLKPYVYRGLFRCGECGCIITTETQKGHRYLRCTKRKTPCHQPYVREEVITDQLAEEIARLALPVGWPERMLGALDEEKRELEIAVTRAVQQANEELADCETRLDTLLDLVLNKAISKEEYASKKQTLLNQKADIRAKLAQWETKGGKRFEPLRTFILEAKKAVFLAHQKKPDACRDFIKKTGSNLVLTDQRLVVSFKNPWNILAIFNSSRAQRVAQTRRTSHSLGWRCLLNLVRTAVLGPE